MIRVSLFSPIDPKASTVVHPAGALVVSVVHRDGELLTGTRRCINARPEFECGMRVLASERSYNEPVELARMCWRQASLTNSSGVAAHLRRMAREDQQEAAKFDGGKLPAIGESETDRQPIV
jgi:hypothetical protein